MKSAIFAASLMASGAVAAAVGHPHQRFHKRENDVVWVTEIDYVTEIVDATTTIWVTSGSKITVSPTRQVEQAKPTPEGGAPQFFQGGNKQPAAPSTVSTTVIAVAPQPPVETSAPAPVSPPVVESPPVVDSPSVDPPAAQAPASNSPAVAPPVVDTPTTSSTQQAAASPPPPTYTPPKTGGGSVSSGECSEGTPCSGDITYYDTGLGACGITSYDTEKVVALPHGLMGTKSNDNPYCGRTIAIELNGKTTTATVVDKCMGCEGHSIDLSPAAFDVLADQAVGRTTANWYFTS